MKISVVLLLIASFILLNVASAKTIENSDDCTFAENFFKTSNKKFNSSSRTTSNQYGSICSGKCCNSHEESMVYEKSDDKLKELIKHQLKTLRDLWMTTFVTYQDRLLNLVNHSENRTLHLFYTVYQRMFPLTKQPINELYGSIRSHISTELSHEYGLESTIDVFFKDLFPLAYHHAVESHEIDFMAELSVDYKDCLRKSYEVLKPFGDIPQVTSRILTQYIGSSNIFLRALEEGGKIVGEIEKFSSEHLSSSCRKALLKMDYCGMCKGFANSKPCHSYCSNVLSGCLTFFSNGLENNWGSFVETMENLVASRNKETADKTIKTLDGKLSEAIMYAMTNGPDLEKKVNKICGGHGSKANTRSSQSIAEDSIESITMGSPKAQANNLKWPAPPDSEILQLLSQLDRNKKFALQIANQYCEDENYNKNDIHCWNGVEIGKYALQTVDIYSQKYNPEIPEFENLDENMDLNELNDRIMSLRNSINKQIAFLSKVESDKMLSDMASHYGSGDRDMDDDDDIDDDELSGDDDFSGNGDGDQGTITHTEEHPSVVLRNPTTVNSSCSLSDKTSLNFFILSSFSYLLYLIRNSLYV